MTIQVLHASNQALIRRVPVGAGMTIQVLHDDDHALVSRVPARAV